MSSNNLSEYPNHLNPFKTRRNSISNSFRKVFRSFRGKDKDRPTKYTDVQPQRHTIQPTGPVELILPEVLPRSRFKERLEKTEVLKRESKDKHWYNDALNPFQSEDTTKTQSEIQPEQPPVPAVRKHRRRKKRTAPLPPGSVNGDGQYLDVPSRTGSKWSLTSTDTDISSACYSEAESEYPLEISEERNEEIMQITREIAKFTDDSNNNITTNHEVSIRIEDVDKVDAAETKAQEEEKKEETPQVIPEISIEPENSIENQEPKNDPPVTQAEDATPEQKEENTKEPETPPPKEEDVTPKIPNGHVVGGTTEDHKNSNGCVKTVDESSSIEKTEDVGCESAINANGGVNKLRVKIIDNQEVVLRYPEYESDDDGSRLSFQKKLQHFESFRESSQPNKIRQTVLTKEKLLGTD